MMSQSDQSDNSDPEVVAVSRHGQATIPKRFREKLGIEAPGRVAFRETSDGEVIVEQVPSPNEMRGFAADREALTETPATEILREKREADRRERDDRSTEE